MRLPIESWLEQQELPGESVIAFSESVLAYKSGAYRAALLFSYVGMGLCLRRRLLGATPPAGFDPSRWSSTIAKLQSEDSWDAEVFDCTQRQQSPVIFSVEPHLREEMRYWKNRRNDCAHYKRNEIGAPHVEAFWLFLRSNLGRWVPNGSGNDVLSRLERHFDANLTPPGTDVEPLIRMIPNAVSEEELEGFFESIVRAFTKTLGNVYFLDHDAVTSIFGKLLSAAPQSYAERAAEWIRQTPERILDLLRANPEQAVILDGHPSLVRHLWRSQLFGGGQADLELYAALLRNSLIPESEIREAHEHVTTKISRVVSTAEQDRILTATGFWPVFDEKAFAKGAINTFQWGNPNAGLIAWRIGNHPIDSDIALAICTTFAVEPYPFQVRDALKEMLAVNPLKLAELESLASTLGRAVPEVLK